MDEELVKFLKLVPTARWRYPPKIWNEQVRAALSDSLIKIGWGGVIELTDAGKIAAHL